MVKYPLRGESAMMYLKQCPKCHGDLYVGEDIHGRYMSCMQCGYLRDLNVESPQDQTEVPVAIDVPKTVKRRRRKVPQAA